MEKKKIKKFLREKWYLVGGSALFLICGIVALLVGFNMTGWSILDWLKSPYATTFFILLGIGIILFVIIFITIKRIHLGD